MPKGTYTLLIRLHDSATVEFGAAGERDLRAGWYAYTGSAFGTGGFSRVERHRELAAGERDARHWHVDYLLGHPASQIVEVVKTVAEDVECEISRGIDAGVDSDEPSDFLAGLGASDCDCDSHLRFSVERGRLERVVRDSHESASD